MGELLGTIARTQWTAPDPLENLPDTSLNDNSSLDLDSDSGTHSSMPGLRPISETGESNYDSDSLFRLPDRYNNERRQEPSERSLEDVEQRLAAMWRSILDASEKRSKDEDAEGSESGDLKDAGDNDPDTSKQVNEPTHVIEISDEDDDSDDSDIEMSLTNRKGNIGDPLKDRLREVLTLCQPYPGDPPGTDNSCSERFQIGWDPEGFYEIYDITRGVFSYLHRAHLLHRGFSVGFWYTEKFVRRLRHQFSWRVAVDWVSGYIYSTFVGSPLEERVGDALNEGALYLSEPSPSIQYGKRFRVSSILDNPYCLHIYDELRAPTEILPDLSKLQPATLV